MIIYNIYLINGGFFMENLKMVKTKDLALYVSEQEFFFGNLIDQGESGYLLLGLYEYRFYRPNKEEVNSYFAPNEVGQRVLELKNFSKENSNATLQFMFSGNENLLLQRLYECDEVSIQTLQNIALHMNVSFRGRRLVHRGNISVQKDLYEINDQIKKVKNFNAAIEAGLDE